MKKIPKPVLDGKPVDKITAYLFHAGGNDDPQKLMANEGKSFIGSKIDGQGFTFDDGNSDATSIAEMKRLIDKDPRNQERIFPYLGGEDFNSNPTQAHHRYVINFEEMSEEEARAWPDLMAIVEQKVKPERMKQKDRSRREKWWLFGGRQKAGSRAIIGLDQVLVIAQTSNAFAFALQPSNRIFSHGLVIFPDARYGFFCCLQNRVHQIWTKFFSSSIGDGLRYIPSDCFQNFPFPKNWETNSELEAIGREYYESRATLMSRNNQGLTDTYNRFHDPDETDPEILKLRELHSRMDVAVLAAYGWADIPNTCDFCLDHEDEENTDTESTEGKRQRKKPWRYRWPDAVHDEVLARLLELNQQRYEAEVLGGQQAQKKANPKKLLGVKTSIKAPSSHPLDKEPLGFF